MSSSSHRSILFRVLVISILFVCRITNAKKSESLEKSSHHQKKVSFKPFQHPTDFQNIQNDGISHNMQQQFRSNSKKDLEWNELSHSKSDVNSNVVENYEEQYEDDSYYVDEELVPHISQNIPTSANGNIHYHENSDYEDFGRREGFGRGAEGRNSPHPNHKKPFQYTSIISTRYGDIQGAYHEVPGGKGRVAVFLGIPYATPPVKSNRLSPTRAATQWKGIMKAVKMAPACPQIPPDHLKEFFRHQSEDCLYLNIYVPDGVKSAAVVVVIHGESYNWGSGSVYDGKVLSSVGKLIVVTLNYRLGILGFLNPNNERHRPIVANYGLMDQLAALHWLQENIASFGGDPAQVTVLGRGYAAAALNFLIISPAAAGAGLFKRAIMLSGSALSPWALVKDPAHYALQTSKQLKCFSLEPDQPTVEEMIGCLRNRSLDEIMQVSLETPQFLSSMGPSIDGVTIHTDWQQQMAKMGKEGRTPVDILLGISELEPVSTFSAKELVEGFDEDHRDRLFRTYVTNNYHFHLQELVLAITAEYTDWSRPTQFASLIRDYTAEALHDASVVAPVTAAAVNLASSGRSLYFYVLDNKRRDENPLTLPKTELCYVLGTPMGATISILPQTNYTRADSAVSEAFIRYLSDFVRTGDPNNSGNDQQPKERNDLRSFGAQSWDPFDATFRRYLEIGPTTTRIRDHFRADQVALWTWLIPGLERLGSRHGANSTFHRFVGGPGAFSGPTRPNSFLPPPPTTPPSTSPFPGGALQHKNSSYHMAQDASVRDRLGHSSGSLFGDGEIGLPYTTALSLTAALGITLLLLNVLVLAAVHYRKTSQQKVPPNRQQGVSPSHCGTMHSSTTLRSLACPQDWPPEYTTCYPENGSQIHMHQQLEQQQRQMSHIIQDQQEPQSHPQSHILSPQEHIQMDHSICDQQYQLHSNPISEQSSQQVMHHHLTHLNSEEDDNSRNCSGDNSQSKGTLRKTKYPLNGTSTIKIIRKPSPPERSSSVPPPDCDVVPHISATEGTNMSLHDPG